MIALEKQVCTIEQGIRLKELGIINDSLWCWVYPKNKQIISSTKGVHYFHLAEEIIADNGGDDFDSEICSAFTVSELGIMLPNGYDTMPITSKYSTNVTVWQGYDDDGNDFTNEPFNNEAECRAAMIIHLLESKLITPADINQRLSPSGEK